MEFKQIRHTHTWPILMLPTVYTEELSYYEQLSKISYKVNEVIDAVNQFTDDYKAYTDNAVATLKTHVDASDSQIKATMAANDKAVRDLIAQKVSEIYTDMKSVEDRLQANIDSLDSRLVQYVNTQIANLRAYVDTTASALYAAIDALRDYSDAQDADLRRGLIAYIDAQIQELKKMIDDIIVDPQQTLVDPSDLQSKKIQQAIDNMYENLRSWALTAEAYDALGITAEAYDAKGLTAYQYDYLGMWYLKEKPGVMGYTDARVDALEPLLHAYSPFTGEYQPFRDIIYQIGQYLRWDSLTAQEYDDLGLTAEAYDGKGLTAEDYEWHGKPLLTGVYSIHGFDTAEITAGNYDSENARILLAPQSV